MSTVLRLLSCRTDDFMACPCRTTPETLCFHLDTAISRRRSSNDAHAFTKSDSRIAVAFAPRAHDHFVAVCQKCSRLAARQFDGTRASMRHFEQATPAARAGPGQRAACHQIARAQIA